MDKIRYSSFKFKVWEDKIYKMEKQRQAIHLDDIILNNALTLKKHSSNDLFGVGLLDF